MMRHIHGSRWAAGALAVAVVATACNPKQELLAPQQPGVIAPGDIQNATGADALYVGALGRMKVALNGSPTNSGSNQEAAWNWTGLFTDEFKSGDTFSQRNDADQRNLQDNDALVTQIWAGMQQGRGYAREAINALQKYDATATAKIAEMYFAMGFLELNLGQEFCNGIPLGETVDGKPVYTNPLTTADVFKSAIARFDTALTMLGSASDAASNNVRTAAIIAKARAQVDLGQFSTAATTVAGISTGYQYNVNYSNTTVDNQWWILGPSVQRYSLGDSVDVTGPVLNAIPFASANDPRVPVDSGAKKPGEDNQTLFVWTPRLAGRDDPLPLVSGIDARLIEAENQLQQANYVGMVATLNALRASKQTIGVFVTPVMPAITTIPVTKDDAINLLFREKAFWQFGRGIRMDDLRRLVRQYSRPQDQVFPTGKFFKTGNYGTEVAFPVPDAERTNPNFHGCIDRNA